MWRHALSLLWCVALLSTAQLASAQASGALPVLRGAVFDSVAGKPLVGAVVQVVVPGSASAPWTAVSDLTGRYRVANLPPGRVVIGFYHDALTDLGLDAPTRLVELAIDAEAVVDLAIPSSEAIRTLRCGESSPFAAGMLVGFVRDAESRGAIAGSAAVVHWRAFALDSANYRVVEERARATVEDDGALLVCHLPVDAPLDLLVTAPGHRSIAGTVVMIPASGIGRLDILLADSTRTAGPAIIRGKVLRESGKAVESGRVIIKALGREVPVKDGEFAAADLPAGTWVAEARVIGVEPQDVMVTASDSAIATTSITVSNSPQRLDAVTVVGKPDRQLRLLDDVLRRKRIGMGTTFLPGHPALRSATFVSDVMREARGFLYQGPNRILGRVQPEGGPCPYVAVYVDDVRQPGGFAGLDHAASVKEVLAIETWPDIMLAPVQYRRGTMSTGGIAGSSGGIAEQPEPPPCALVLVWTRRRF